MEALTSGLKVARLPTDCLARVPNPGIGEWEPCARVVDGSMALPGRERIRPLFAELHDTGNPCFVVSGQCAVDKCKLRDEDSRPRDRQFLTFAIHELEAGQVMRNSTQKENPPQVAQHTRAGMQMFVKTQTRKIRATDVESSVFTGIKAKVQIRASFLCKLRRSFPGVHLGCDWALSDYKIQKRRTLRLRLILLLRKACRSS